MVGMTVRDCAKGVVSSSPRRALRSKNKKSLKKTARDIQPQYQIGIAVSRFYLFIRKLEQ
jgi:hypothetical protein